MPKRNKAAQRAWRLFRFMFLGARKGGLLRKRFMTEVPKFLKRLGHTRTARRGQIYFGERELSFDKTPIIHGKMHRSASMRYIIPCITPEVDFDLDINEVHNQEQDGGYEYYGRRESFLTNSVGEEECEYDGTCEEEGIDLRAEKFIANFYEQMRRQRQKFYHEYK